MSFNKNDLLTMHVIAIGNAFASTDSAQSIACSHFLEFSTSSSVDITYYRANTLAHSPITSQ